MVSSEFRGLRAEFWTTRLKRHLIGVSVIGVFFLWLYLSTLAPDVLTADNAEFQYVGTLLGVAHPPGFPLYTMLAHGMTRLPLAASPAYKINLLSVFTSLGTLWLVYLTIYRLTDNSFRACWRPWH